MPVINTNVNAIIARNAGSVNDRSMTKAMQALSTGKRINVAADDAAGLAISTKMTSQIRGLDQAIRNANDGISMLQVVEGATVEMTNMLQRMRELAIQSVNDSNTSAERSYLNDEFVQLRTEIDRIAQTTQWNGVNVMDEGVASGGIGTRLTTGVGGRTVSFQVGANDDAEQKISFNIGNFSTAGATVSNTTTTVTTPAADSVDSYNFASAGVTELDAIGSAASNAGSLIFTNSTNQSVTLLGSADPLNATVMTKLAALADVGATADDWAAAATAINAALALHDNADTVTVSSTGIGNLTITDSSNDTWTLTGSDGDTGVITAANYVKVHTAGATEVSTSTTTSGAVGVFSGLDLDTQVITDSGVATTAIGALDSALTNLNAQRSAIGATINRLTYAADNLTNTSANVNAARSRVLDTDYASATTELARTQIIQQASTAMLAQANQGAQSVLSLLK